MDDLISRQAAIDAIEPTIKSILQGNSFKAINVMDKIRDLPSAEPEIIRCKDCEWWRQGFPYDYCDKHQMVASEDCFCSWSAERRRR